MAKTLPVSIPPTITHSSTRQQTPLQNHRVPNCTALKMKFSQQARQKSLRESATMVQLEAQLRPLTELVIRLLRAEVLVLKAMTCAVKAERFPLQSRLAESRADIWSCRFWQRLMRESRQLMREVAQGRRESKVEVELRHCLRVMYLLMKSDSDQMLFELLLNFQLKEMHRKPVEEKAVPLVIVAEYTTSVAFPEQLTLSNTQQSLMQPLALLAISFICCRATAGLSSVVTVLGVSTYIPLLQLPKALIHAVILSVDVFRFMQVALELSSRLRQVLMSLQSLLTVAVSLLIEKDWLMLPLPQKQGERVWKMWLKGVGVVDEEQTLSLL